MVGTDAEWRHPHFVWDELTDSLTFANTEDVILFSEQQRQALHQ